MASEHVSVETAHNKEDILLASLIEGGNEYFNEVINLINVQHFTNANNKKIFTICKEIYDDNKQINSGSVLTKSLELNISVDNILNTEKVDLNNTKNIAKNIYNEYNQKYSLLKLRQIINQILQLSATEFEDQIFSIMENMNSTLLTQINSSESNVINLKDIADDLVNFWRENPSENVGLPTPWPKFNNSIGGGMRTGVTLIGARSGVGKTSIAVMVAVYLASLGVPILFLDTEMEYADILPRILANISSVPIREIETGGFASNDFYNKNVAEAVEQIKQSKFFYKTIAGKSFDEILSIIRKWIHIDVGITKEGKANQCLVIYDYFKIMDSAEISDMQEYQAMGFQISKLTDFCKKYALPCLSFVQLNRDGVAKEGTDVIAQSDRLLWLCNSFSIFKAKSKEELEADNYTGGNRKLITLKSRYGGEHLPGEYIPMIYEGSTCSLQEILEINSSKQNEII